MGLDDKPTSCLGPYVDFGLSESISPLTQNQSWHLGGLKKLLFTAERFFTCDLKPYAVVYDGRRLERPRKPAGSFGGRLLLRRIPVETLVLTAHDFLFVQEVSCCFFGMKQVAIKYQEFLARDSGLLRRGYVQFDRLELHTTLGLVQPRFNSASA